MISALCDDRNDKGAYLRCGNCHLHAVQLKRKRQYRRENKRTDRLGVDQEVGQRRLFRCVKIRGCDADKRQKQHSRKEKRQKMTNIGICACRCVEQQPDFRAGQEGHRCTDCRNDKRRKVSDASRLPDIFHFAFTIIKVNRQSR